MAAAGPKATAKPVRHGGPALPGGRLDTNYLPVQTGHHDAVAADARRQVQMNNPHGNHS